MGDQGVMGRVLLRVGGGMVLLAMTVVVAVAAGYALAAAR